MVVAALILAFAPAGRWPIPRWEATTVELCALGGLLFGSCLVLIATRDYLLGFAGVAISVFLSTVLAVISGLTLYIAGFAQPIAFGLSTPAWRQHLAIAFALAGVIAALLLPATPWSRRYLVAQPALVATTLVAPTLALATLHGTRAFAYGFGDLPTLGGDPLLVLAVTAGLLAVPLAVACTIEWISACAGAGSRMATQLVKRPAWVCAVVCAEVGWLVAGSIGRLPRWLGGTLGAWELVRGAHASAWLFAVLATAATALFVASVAKIPNRIDLEEAKNASYVSTTLLFYVGVVGGFTIFITGVRLVLAQVMPAAWWPIMICCCVFGLAVFLLWSASDRPRWVRVTVAATIGAGLFAAGLLWPINAIPHRITDVLPKRFMPALGKALDSSILVACTAGWAAILCLGTWGVLIWLIRRIKAVNLDGTVQRWTLYESAIVPLGFWLLILAAAAFLRGTSGWTLSVFDRPALPDPVVLTMVAVPVAALVALRGRRNDDRGRAITNAALTVVIALPLVAFLPFAVPADFGPQGRLGVIALAAPIIYGITLGGAPVSRGPEAPRRRRLIWLAGTSAFVLPLCAYLAVFGGQRGLLTSTLVDTGVSGTDTGVGAHLRLVLLIPLFVTFIASRQAPSKADQQDKPPTDRQDGPPPSRWRDLRADALIFATRDGHLDEVYLDQLRSFLSTLTPDELNHYANELAERSGTQGAGKEVAFSVDELVNASKHEIEDAASLVIEGPFEGDEEFDRNIARAREQIGAQLACVRSFNPLEAFLGDWNWLLPATRHSE